MRYFTLSLLAYLGLSSPLWAREASLFQQKDTFSSKPLQEVATLGAPITGSLIEGSVGAFHKGYRHRFHSYSSPPTSGFLGSEKTIKPLTLKDQPGVFPAPLMGSASLTFTFSCHPNFQGCLTPVIVRPDGTIFKGLPMTQQNSPQTLEISSPAQTGIYTLFALNHHKKKENSKLQVDASISNQPHYLETFYLESLEMNHRNAEFISAHFIYTEKN